MNEIDKFERNNEGLAVNVFGFKDGEVWPLRCLEVEGKMIDLFWFKDGEKTHYCWVKSLSRLVFGQVSTDEHKFEVCRRCLNRISADDRRKERKKLTVEEKMKQHLELCGKFDFVKTVLQQQGQSKAN